MAETKVFFNVEENQNRSFVQNAFGEHSKFDTTDKLCFADQCPFTIKSVVSVNDQVFAIDDKEYQIVAKPKTTDEDVKSMCPVIAASLYITECFSKAKQAFFNQSRTKVNAFVLVGYDPDTVLELCEEQFRGFDVHYRVTHLPFDVKMFYGITTTTFDEEIKGNLPVARVHGLPNHCLIELSKTNKFKKFDPLSNNHVFKIVKEHYFTFYNSLNYELVKIN